MEEVPSSLELLVVQAHHEVEVDPCPCELSADEVPVASQRVEPLSRAPSGTHWRANEDQRLLVPEDLMGL